MRSEALSGADELRDQARLQAELAATLERADRAEVQLRNANAEVSRMLDELEHHQKELVEAQCSLAKSQEETAAATSLAISRGARAAELEHELTVLREKSYQLDVEAVGTTTEQQLLKAELANAYNLINESAAARNQLNQQLTDVTKVQARSAAAAAAAEDKLKADMQQLQVRLAASEGECRALQHAKGTLHDDFHRARGEILALQGQLQEESRQREEQASECRRLQRNLEMTSEVLTQAQRAQRSTAAGSADLEAEVERLRSGRIAMESEMQASNARMQRLQEEARQITERASELAGQLHGLSATVRQLEAENARLADGHATLRVEVEARAAEARAARGEAAELAADRARLLAEVQAVREDVEPEEVSRLRDALSQTRSEVARLRKELAANDVVLAEAESALVALVGEKDGLEQQLTATRAAERLATAAAEGLLAQVAALQGQLKALEDTSASLAPFGTEVSGGMAGVVDDRMINYLQSLGVDDPSARPSAGGTDLTTASVDFASIGPDPEVAATPIATVASVRAAPATAPVPAARRYPAGPRTSESGSTLSAFRQGGHNADVWEALSTSGWDNSAGGSGGGVTASGMLLFSPGMVVNEPTSPAVLLPVGPASSVAYPRETVLVEATGSLETIASGGPGEATATTSGPEVSAGPGPRRQDSLPTSSRMIPSTTCSVTGSEGDGTDVDAAQAASPSSVPVDLVRSTSSHIAAGMLNECTSPAIQNATAVDVVSGADLVRPASPSDLLSPRSPSGVNSHRFALERAVSSTRQGPEHVKDEMVAQSPASAPYSAGQPAAVQAHATDSAAGVADTTATTAATTPRGVIFGTEPERNDAASPSSTQLPSSSLLSYQPHRTATPTVEPSAATALSASIYAHAGAVAEPYSPSTSLHAKGVSVSMGQLAAMAEGGSPLQNAYYRLSPRNGHATPRATPPGTAVIDGNDHTTGSRSASLGGGGAATGSPMISPRIMLEARMLSRAVRPSAEALSNSLRPISTTPSIGGVMESGVAAATPLQQDFAHGEVRSTTISTSSTILHALASGLHQSPSRQLQQPYQMPSLSAVANTPASAAEFPETDASAFSSAIASSIATAAVAAPKIAVLADTVVSSPSPAYPEANLSLEQLAQRISKESSSTGHEVGTATTRDAVSAGMFRPSFSVPLVARPPLANVSGTVGSQASLGADGPVHLQPQKVHAQAEGAPQCLGQQLTPKGNALVGASSGVGTLPGYVESCEDVLLAQRLAVMDEALRAIGAM